MLDIKRLRTDPEAAREGLSARGADPAAVDSVLDHDRQRREKLTEVEGLKAERKTVSKQIGVRKAAGEEVESVMEDMRVLGDRIAALDEEVRRIDEVLDDAMLRIPNMPHATTPRGLSESDNEVVRTVGEIPTFDFEPKSHIELGESLGLMDMKRAARMSGSGFPLFIGQEVAGSTNFTISTLSN